MRKLIGLSLIVALASASPVFAKSSKEEGIGVGAGVVVGALAGGPIGAIIGAAVGAKVGDTMHQKTEAIDELTVSLDSTRRDATSLENDVRSLNRNIDDLTAEIERFRSVDRPQLVNLMQAGIEMDLLFRTDEHSLADSTGARLAELAAGLATMSDIHVRLDGFADERGDADYNQALSQKRVDFVRDQLVSAGIHPSRIQVAAHGESPAQDDNVDSYALERRVSLKLFIADDAQPFAQSVD